MLIDRYIFQEWIKVFVMALGVSLGLLLLADVYDNLPDFLAAKATRGQMWTYYSSVVPTFLPIIVPLGVLISLLFSLGSLHKHHEIVALRAAGRSLFQMTRSLWLAVFLICIGMFFLNIHWVPVCVERTQDFLSKLEEQGHQIAPDDAGFILTPTFTFAHPLEKRIWVMDSFCEKTYQAFGVNVYACNSEGAEIIRVTAREGYYDDQAKHWVFLQGREMIFDVQTGSPIRVLNFEKKFLPDWTESPQLMQLMAKQPKMLSLNQIESAIDAITDGDPTRVKSYEVRYQSMLSSPWLSLIAACLAIPFAVLGVRTNPFVGVSRCIGVFFLYYFIVHVCHIFGEQGTFPIFVAVWFPMIMALAFSAFLYHRAR
jgi:lipopolysaccharide export system permease protein